MPEHFARNLSATLAGALLIALETWLASGYLTEASLVFLAPICLPLVLLPMPRPLALLLPAVLFLASSSGLLKGQAATPKRSLVLFGALGALSITFYASRLLWAIECKLLLYYFALLATSLTMLAISFLAAYSSKKSPNFYKNLIAHLLFFLWLGSYSFPYLFEAI
jgi:hypothetical protein